jgi:tetratricopeptide (TPR) repeat protein
MTQSALKWTEYSSYLVSERAYLLYEEGRFYEALILFEGLLELDSEDRYCRDAVTALYLARGQPEQAVRHASLILKAEPAHVNALAKRCEAYLLLGMTQEAERDLQTLQILQAKVATLRMQMRLNAVSQRQFGITSQPNIFEVSNTTPIRDNDN